MTTPLPLVLVPGLYGSPRLFADQLPALWGQGRAVTVAHHGGHDDLAAIAAAVLAQAPPRFALAGFSMGGMVAMAMQRQAPDRVARLALLDTSAALDDEQVLAVRRATIDALRGGGLAIDDAVAMSMPALVHPTRVDDAPLRATLTAMFNETGNDAAIRQQLALIGRADARPGLAGVSVPTLVLVGADDTVTPPARADEIAAAIPHATRVTIPDAGHMTPLEQPAAVTDVLLAWLN
jgi:pimeloyl-ACP methyl ester carboxylesterase